MKKIKRKELTAWLRNIALGEKLDRPVILLRKDDHEFRRIIDDVFREELFGAVTNFVDMAVYGPDLQWLPEKSKNDNIRVFCGQEDELTSLGIDAAVFLCRTTNKPVIYSLLIPGPEELNAKFGDQFEIVEFDSPKEEWLEWAQEIDSETGKPRFSPIITEFIKNVDEKYLNGDYECPGRLYWDSINTAASMPIEVIKEDMEENGYDVEQIEENMLRKIYIANEVEDLFVDTRARNIRSSYCTDDIGNVFADYYDIGDMLKV